MSTKTTVAMNVRGGLNVTQMALVVASLAWLYPARTIRAQLLTLRERSYIQVAQMSGMSGPEIIVKEMLPNLLPYLTAALVNATSAAILASIGLEVLGLGPFEAPTIGMTLYWVNYNAAIINGWWWWWIPPIVVIGVVFIGLSPSPSLVDSRDIALKDITAVGILSASPGLAGAIEAFASGAVVPDALVAEVVRLEEVPSRLEGSRGPDAGPGPKVHVDPRA